MCLRCETRALFFAVAGVCCYCFFRKGGVGYKQKHKRTDAGDALRARYLPYMLANKFGASP